MNYYYDSILKAVNYIEDNLTRDINLSDITGHVGFSKFHFLRLFKAISGYTLNYYIRRRRATVASKLLLETDMKIIDIAIMYGYNSHEAFTRAFKEVYNITPHFFRVEKPCYENLKQLPLTEEMLSFKYDIDYVEPEIIERDELLLMGLSYEGKNENNELPKLWNKLFKDTDFFNKNINKEGFYGLEQYSENTQEDGCFKYLASIEANKFDVINSGLEAVKIEKSKYAVFPIRSIIENVPRSIARIYSTHLPLSGLKLKGDYDFEYYDKSFIPNSSNSFFYLYIPIE